MNNRENFLDDPYKLAKYIKESVKSTPVKVYLKGILGDIDFSNFRYFGDNNFKILFGEWDDFQKLFSKHNDKIEDYQIEYDRRNSAIPILDIKDINARIEPGAIIRSKVKIGKNAVIMMGAVINIGAEIGENTMIDMNAVIGARAKIGSNVHIGAGAVIAGVLEPPSKEPVSIDDGVLIGANAVVLEGINIGAGSVVAAGSVVTKNVPPNSVVAGIPAKFLKNKDEISPDKTTLLEDLRKWKAERNSFQLYFYSKVKIYGTFL